LSIATPKTQSLIDTIGMGYRALNRRLWVIALPITLSALLWFTPPIVLGDNFGGRELAAAVQSLGGATADQQALLTRVLTSDLRVALAWFNVVPLLSPAPIEPDGAAFALADPGAFLLTLALINVIALLASSLFLTSVAAAVRNEELRPLGELRQALRTAGVLVLVALIVLGVGIVLGLPFLALSTILIAVLPMAAVPILLLWYIAIFWASIYAGFAPEAIVLSRSGPLQALYNSVNLVQRNLAATLGLLLVTIVITSGLAIVWRQLAATPAGLAIALVGSAYVGSGLGAARMEFYRERMARWKRTA
jgi:hypothetical protein